MDVHLIHVAMRKDSWNSFCSIVLLCYAQHARHRWVLHVPCGCTLLLFCRCRLLFCLRLNNYRCASWEGVVFACARGKEWLCLCKGECLWTGSIATSEIYRGPPEESQRAQTHSLDYLSHAGKKKVQYEFNWTFLLQGQYVTGRASKLIIEIKHIDACFNH